jgi:hypothetical protein
MNAEPGILQKLRALGARVESDGDRLILRAGKRPVPEPLVEEVRAAKAELLTFLSAKALTSRHSVGDEHLRQKTAPKAAETLEFCEDAHGEHLREHLRQDGEHLREDGEHLRQDPQKSSILALDRPVFEDGAATKVLTKALTPEHLRRGKDLCGFEAPGMPKVLTSQRTSGDEHLRKIATSATAGVACCECGLPVAELLETWWGGERCHRTCGEAAFEREKKAIRGLGGPNSTTEGGA